MNTLQSAWSWYESTKSGLRVVSRFARKHWSSWDSSSSFHQDQAVRDLDPDQLYTEAEQALEQLDDFAVFVLFSSFESEIRRLLLEVTRQERTAVTHPALVYWMVQAETAIEEGSFFRLLEAMKTSEHLDSIEQVNQIRRYRNWVAHGRSGKRPESVTPHIAYQRLGRLLQVFRAPIAIAP
jgi:hypothetical protein